ncbi:MAG: hypothetical protein H6673_01945 [Anaerolineales bacterium]|nr:hypothetical protein [Anaerolineales bacterium]
MNNEQIQKIAAMRDQKAREHLSQYAPLWLVAEKPIPNEDAIQFNVVFYHPRYGWVNRRYRYDAFADVLYHKGQTRMDEDEAIAVQEKEPYILAPSINTVDSYGG